jgi:hypothetical protein
MRIAQIVMPAASQYECKCQRVDAAALAPEHQVVLMKNVSEARESDADVAHVYSATPLPASSFTGFTIPFVASAELKSGRWLWRRPATPAHIVSPATEVTSTGRFVHLPEAVEDEYWQIETDRGSLPSRPAKVVGSAARGSIRNMVEQTLARIHRFREDVSWRMFESPPPPSEMRELDAWIDPAVDEDDFDGFVAEALVIGLPVVAARTTINTIRLERGRTGMLVPPRDPNELTHAILAVLFKPEVANSKQQAARQTRSRFRSRRRIAILTRLYETLIP